MDNDTPKFQNYPPSKEVEETSFSSTIKPVPALRGRALAVTASLVSTFTPLQSLLWKQGGFSIIDKLDLDDYEPRYDPTVIPIASTLTSSSSTTTPSSTSQSPYYTTAFYTSHYTAGTLTPLSVVKALLPLIRRDTDPPGSHSVAFLSTNPVKVLCAAEASTKRYASGHPLGPLDGVPVAVKDEVDVHGMRRSLGTRVEWSAGDHTSWCVRMWEDMGAIVLGKCNMHQLGLDTTNQNPHTSTPLCPFSPPNESYYTGGSSGGSAHVLATNLVPLALGADGGGSIRIPSAFCSMYGLKPSAGRVSGFPTPSLSPSCGVLGPMASSLDDLELGYVTMARQRPDSSPSNLPFPPPQYPLRRPGSTQRLLGVYDAWLTPTACPDAAVRQACLDAIAFYRDKRDYTIVPITLPHLAEAQAAHAMTILAEIASSIPPARFDALTSANKLLVAVSSRTPAHALVRAQRLRNLLMQHLASLWQRFPGLVIVSPATPMRGWKVGGSKAHGDAADRYGASESNLQRLCMRYVFLANFTGCPALVRPIGYVSESAEQGAGLPIGMMGMAEWGAEMELMQWARHGEAVLELNGGMRRSRGSGAEAWVDVVELVRAMEH